MSGDRRSPYLNWRVVSDPSAAAAAAMLLTPERMSRRWFGLSAAARDLHHEIHSGYFKSGSAPDPDSIAVPQALAELRKRDLVFFEDEGIGAYPFAPSDSGHLVSTGTSSYRAVCVIDAFGIASMLGRPVRIETRCGGCDTSIAFEVEGCHVKRCAPADTLVWAAVRDTSGCAATSQCRTMRAFCSEDHLASRTGGADGFVLSASQAAQIGAAIFGPGSAFGETLADV